MGRVSNSSMSSSQRVSQLQNDFFRTFAALLRWRTDKSASESWEAHGKCQKLLIISLEWKEHERFCQFLVNVKSNCAAFCLPECFPDNIILLFKSYVKSEK